MGLLTPLRALVRRNGPASAPPSGLVPLRLRQKYREPGGPLFNVGEIAGFSPPVAARLLALGVATRAKPGAVSTVRPRVEPGPPQDNEHTREIRAAVDREGIWMPTDDAGMIVWQWPPRDATNDRTNRR